MRVNLNTRVAQLTDFIYVMESAVMGKTCYENGIPGLEASVDVCSTFESIMNDYDWKTTGLLLLFKPVGEKNGYVKDAFLDKLYRLGTVGNLINRVLGDPHVLIATLYEYFSGKAIHPETMTGKELRKRISKLDLPDDVMQEFLEFSKRPMGIASGLKKFMNRIRRRIKNAYAENVDIIRNASKVTGIHLRHEGAGFLETPFKALPEDMQEMNSRTTVTVVYLNEFSIQRLEQEDSTLVILGYRYKEALNAMCIDTSREDMERFLKSFSESNRIAMIRMITENPMFVGEVSEKTNLAISTTSYHLDMLMAAGVFDHKVIDKRAYYTMRSAYVADMFVKISELFRREEF